MQYFTSTTEDRYDILRSPIKLYEWREYSVKELSDITGIIVTRIIDYCIHVNSWWVSEHSDLTYEEARLVLENFGYVNDRESSVDEYPERQHLDRAHRALQTLIDTVDGFVTIEQWEEYFPEYNYTDYVSTLSIICKDIRNILDRLQLNNKRL